MAGSKWRLIAFAGIASCASFASAAGVTSVKTVVLLHNDTNSPFFKTSADGATTFNNYSNSGGTFTPVDNPRAGESSSITTQGLFTIVGNSTSAGGWTNNNGVPKGLTLTFTADITFSVGPGSPAGSFLTLSGNAAADVGNGMGITQAFHNISGLESFNLNEIPNTTPFDPNDLSETLAVSAVNVSAVNFSGTLEEAGFTFTPGTVGNFGPYVLRSPGFADANETAALLSANNSVDPLGQGRPTVGFGVPSSDPSEAGRGQGFVQSNALIRNSTNSITATGRANFFPRQPGAFTFTMQNGTMAFKGIGYEYDVSFDISATPVGVTGDYNHNGTVDAADYVLWRNGDIAADGNGDSVVNQLDYDVWRANFGNAGAGSGAGLGTAQVPEPAAAALLVVAAIAALAGRRRFAFRQ